MRSIKKLLFIVPAIILLISLMACAPGAHVRVGIGVHVPGSWVGPYPYPPPPGPVKVGRPATGPYYPAIENPEIRHNFTDHETKRFDL